jgi:hypothetical protein
MIDRNVDEQLTIMPHLVDRGVVKIEVSVVVPIATFIC